MVDMSYMYMCNHKHNHGTQGVSWNSEGILEYRGYHGTLGISWKTEGIMEYRGYHGIQRVS